jgi:signal transduction histidine kinase
MGRCDSTALFFCDDYPHTTEFEENSRIEADPILLKTALRQLVQNAIDFRNPNGKVTVRADAGKKWMLQVADNGFGIPEDQQKKVWDMFYRGHNSSKGAGLGLYLVGEIAQKMNAKASLQSHSTGSSDKINLSKDSTDSETVVTVTFNRFFQETEGAYLGGRSQKYALRIPRNFDRQPRR